MTAQKIVEVSSYFTIISHVKGRLRVRVNPKIQNKVKDVKLADIESLPQKIKGIKNIKINKMVASVIIEYDNDIFEKRLWDNLISGENLDEVVDVINRLEKEII